jgi:NAD(P)-dependent dehydrogenase (short-subunit alcohol dehydrogenase family)
MKTVLITGIGRGIGKSLAEKFLREGYAVIGTTFTSAPAVGISASTADASDAAAPNLAVYSLDLSSDESIAQCAAAIAAAGKKIDIHINNAGALVDENETSVVIETLRKTLQINLVGTIDFTERMLSLVNAGGHIVNISSSAASLAEVEYESHEPGHYPSYKISKTALNMYTRTLAMRLKGNITVSSVHPGWTKTDMGGAKADFTPDEAAAHIFDLAVSTPETGQFWFNGKKIPW